VAEPLAISHRGYGRLARRLILLFVVVSLVPLIVSDWLAIYATSDVNRDLQKKAESQRVHLVGRQVFDKLLNAKLLVANFPDGGGSSKLPGLGSVFASARFVRDADASDPLVRAWSDAGQASAVSSAPVAKDGVSLRVVRDGSLPRVLIASSRGEALLWIAEIAHDYLWEAVSDASENNAWKVTDASGATLFASGPAAASNPSPIRTRIFLGAEFGSDDWIFESDLTDAAIAWQGLPLGVWLALVATATLLLIALLSLWKIRETLTPLTTLTDSTHSLAHGTMPARVDVRRDDEIGELASAFNDMAARIAAQFATLSDLAAIDRDILKGVSIEALARRVVDQLEKNAADATVHFEWLDANRTIRCVTGSHSAHATAEPDPTPDRVQRFLTLAERASTNNGVVTEPHADCVETIIPITMGGVPRAAIVWRSPHHIGAETLLASFNLRDRMAVAFAAKDREAELVHLATHDSLTGLVSRYELHRVLEKIVDDAAHSSLLFIDLDHFKDINDSRGHHAGDELLCRVGERLRACSPPGAVLARQGGDEFALVLAGIDEDAACSVASKILVEVKKPVMLESGECSLSASIGIAVFPTHARSREGLLRCADVALYAAKAGGRNGFRVFSSALDMAEQTRVQLIADLRGATARSEFELYFQPRVRSRDLKLSGAEALLRWHHPQRGVVGPDDFIHIAEETGAIHEIGEWVIEAAAAQIAAWRRSIGALVRVSINVSPKQFETGTLVERIDGAVSRYGFPHELLEIEITENVLVGDTESAFAQMAALRSRGIRIALDDFGTGYSSMALLSSLPFDVMKIDRSLVEKLSRNDRVRAIVRAITSMGQSANLRLVAEGIETAEQAAELTALGCQELQGFLFGKPVQADIFARGYLARTVVHDGVA
jgi:diguanylate cyclase (GGDEF)-like protein